MGHFQQPHQRSRICTEVEDRADEVAAFIDYHSLVFPFGTQVDPNRAHVNLLSN
jgi:hypothetical protein